MNALRILMAVFRLPALMALCAAASLAVSALAIPALSMQPAARSWPTTLEIPAGLATTVTVKVALTVLGLSSALVAVQVTVVVPIGNVEPEIGVQLTVATGLSPASSPAVGAL